jgi:hypothetical protein
MDRPQEHEGGCLCGSVRVLLRKAPKYRVDCHCIDCRRAGGAPYVTWGSVKKQQLELTSGALSKVRYASRFRSFARCCGTQLFFQKKERPGWISVTIASLDHPNAFSPAMAIWTEDRLPWISLDPSLPSFSQGRK